MEDLTLALITLTSFVLLFVVAIFADRAGLDAGEQLGMTAGSSTGTSDAVAVPVEDSPALAPRADVA